MSYIYDILLNFNKDLIEYFEWEDTDNIKYVKKIMLFKTSTEVIKDITKYEVLLDSSFTSNIPKYELNNSREEGKICLLTDENIVIGLLIENNKVEFISRLLLDEEYDALETASHITTTKINYKKLKEKNNNKNNLTRKELKIKNDLLNRIEYLYKRKKQEELKYLYYEYTNKENNNMDYIYNYLKNSLTIFNGNHINLYKILTMSNIKSD